MLKVAPKIANQATLQNFDVTEKKMNAGFGISDPKLIKFYLFQIKYSFAFDPSNFIKVFFYRSECMVIKCL